MKKRILKILGFTFAVAMIPLSRVEAWGPERDLFSNEKPATYVTFNSIEFNSAIGDERNFVRVVEAGSKDAFKNEVEVEAGKDYRVYIYYHNNASSMFNTKEYNYKGVARNVRVASQFPATIKAGETGVVSGTISATNANPAKVWDEAYFHAKDDVNLYYVTGSAKIYNKWGLNGKVLSTNLFTETGTFVGLDEFNGVVLGCAEYSGQVIYTLSARAVDSIEKPTEPTPTEPEIIVTPEEPTAPTEDPTPSVVVAPEEPTETPKELPNTGPAEIIMASVILLAMLGVLLYFWNSQRMLKKVQESVMGNENEDGDNSLQDKEK